MRMKRLLNLTVFRYALRTIYDNKLTCCTRFNREAIPALLNWLNGRIPVNTTTSEAVVRTQGLSEAFVVASCSSEENNKIFSDYSGKKQRQCVVVDFPHRRADFSAWYGGESKPYQHKVLYDRINTRLGTIGGYANGVNHPIGYCAEQNVANRLLFDADDNIDNIEFSVALRPKTGEIVDYCGNCSTLFPSL